MGTSTARKRKHRRATKSVLKNGKKAKRAHKRIGGRTGSIQNKKLKSLAAGLAASTKGDTE